MTFSVRGDKPIATVYETYSYGKFKLMPGNRPLSNSHISQIVRSIQKNGCIFDPILVNHDGYIIDGQHRWMALQWLKRLKGAAIYPLRYIYIKDIAKALDLEECIVMNSNTINWSVFNYIQAHATKNMGGNKAQYEILYGICQDYAKECNGCIPTTNIVQVAYKYWNKGTYTMLKDGLFEMGKPEEEVRAVLDYLVKFEPYRKKLSRRYELVSRLLWFAFVNESVDEDRLLKQMKRVDDAKNSKINSFDNMDDGLKELTRIYNYGYNELEKVNLRPLYDTMVFDIRKKAAEEILKKKEEKKREVA